MYEVHKSHKLSLGISVELSRILTDFSDDLLLSFLSFLFLADTDCDTVNPACLTRRGYSHD
jgi:hypothetical protein